MPRHLIRQQLKLNQRDFAGFISCKLYREDYVKILTEKSAFSSDQYAVASQARFHGIDPREAIVEIGPRAGEAVIRHLGSGP